MGRGAVGFLLHVVKLLGVQRLEQAQTLVGVCRQESAAAGFAAARIERCQSGLEGFLLVGRVGVGDH